METDENEEILRVLLDDLREALREKKASRALKVVWAAYLSAKRRIYEADQREAQSRP
jgi:hypothetical protein